MSIFEKEKEQPIEAFELTQTMIDDYDATLRREIDNITRVNGGPNSSDDSVMLQYHDTETRKLLAALRENMALIEFYKKRLTN